MLKRLVLIPIILGIMACTGGGKDPAPTPEKPKPTSYGTFRNLTPKAPAPIAAGVPMIAMADTITISGRANHRSILMMNGKVLLWGGDSNRYDLSLEIYDPTTETFTKSTAVPGIPRYNRIGSGDSYSAFGMCNLPNGHVMVLGAGRNDPNTHYWEDYDPETDTILKHDTEIQWAAVEEILYVGNNKVIVFQAYGQNRILDLTTNTWDALTYPEDGIVDACILQGTDGSVWSVGGRWGVWPYWDVQISKSYIYKYDPTTNTWERKTDLLTARHDATAVLLPSGKIGIYGGKHTKYNPSYPNVVTTNLKSVEIYDTVSNTVSYSVDIVGERQQARSVYLQTGYTLIAGGADLDNTVVDTELVHNHSLGFSGSTGAMIHPRYGHSVVNLPNGLVLITGGSGGLAGDGVDKTAEVYDPQSRLYIHFTTEQIVVGGTLQLSTTYAAGVNWEILGDTTHGNISTEGLLTTTTVGIVEIRATAKDDTTLTAVIRISIIPQ